MIRENPFGGNGHSLSTARTNEKCGSQFLCTAFESLGLMEVYVSNIPECDYGKIEVTATAKESLCFSSNMPWLCLMCGR